MRPFLINKIIEHNLVTQTLQQCFPNQKSVDPLKLLKEVGEIPETTWLVFKIIISLKYVGIKEVLSTIMLTNQL